MEVLMSVTRYTDLPKDERDLWEDMLTRQGLSMDQGSSPTWLTYHSGMAGDTGHTPHGQFDYSLFYKPADRRGGKREGAGRKKGQ
jgi:hypothetical protein